MIEKKERTAILFLFLISFFSRIPGIFIVGDTNLDNEWGMIVNNLIQHNTLSYNYYDESLNKFLLPTAYMPPLYVYYLYIFSFLSLGNDSYVLTILLSQALLSSISVIVFYKLNKIFFSKKISFYSSLIFSIIPLHLYACSQISSISLQSFFGITFFYLYFVFIEKKNFSSIIYLSIVTGFLILLRGEFIAIFLSSLFLLIFFFKIPFRKILLILFVTLIVISPYVIRNVIVFEKITITKSFGFNLWKGNNPNSVVEGYATIDKELREKINSIPKTNQYGINFDNIFLDQAKKNIKEDPKKYLNLFIKKFISFLFIDINSSDPNYYNPLHYLPSLILGITSVIGILLSDKKSNKLNLLIIIFFINISIFSCFFILPRYKLVIIPLQIIFTNIFANFIIKRFFYSDAK